MSRPKKQISKAEQWKYARGFFVDLILLIVDFVLEHDEEAKRQMKEQTDEHMERMENIRKSSAQS